MAPSSSLKKAPEESEGEAHATRLAFTQHYVGNSGGGHINLAALVVVENYGGGALSGLDGGKYALLAVIGLEG